MIDYLATLLFLFSQAMGLQSDPAQSWRVLEPWKSESGHYVFTAQLQKTICQNIEDNLQFPQVVHGVHTLLINNKTIYKSGDPSFNKASPFYYSPLVSCALLQNLKAEDSVVWQVKTYSAFFARFEFFPIVQAAENNFSYFYDLQLNLISFGLLIFIMFFSLVVFKNKIPTDQMTAMALASLSLGLYALFCVNSHVMINVSMLSAHKIADVALSMGCLFYLYIFYKNNLLNRGVFYLNVASFLCFVPLILFGLNGDMVQLGTTMQMPFVFMGFLNIAYLSMQKMKYKSFDLAYSIEVFSVLFFILCGTNDIFRIFGLIDSRMILPIGAVVGVFFLVIAVHRDIEKTYFERDDLLLNLKNKVSEQTLHLSSALEQLKKSQADLVQSSRLASLGTLSAGIAHEINNAINYVNGSIVPLEKKIMKHIPEEEKPIVKSLLIAMKQGASLTVDIVKSLRNFTGLNQAKVKDVNIAEVVQSVLTILKSRTNDILVDVQIDKTLSVHCYQIGMNQIFMNLLSNALDVVKTPAGKITIRAEALGERMHIQVSDNGIGIAEENRAKIFDPFFTTKEVGQGTGLGLHIVAKEVERLKGKVFVQSQLGQGTSFIIDFPLEQHQVILSEEIQGAA